MSRVLQALGHFSRHTPDAIALEAATCSISYARLGQLIEAYGAELKRHGGPIAIFADNTPAWAVADLAAMAAGLAVVPVPHFFSPSQIGHLMQRSAARLLLSDQPELVGQLLAALRLDAQRIGKLDVDGISLMLWRLPRQHAGGLFEDCAKVTFTSGSTGEPKGVCLSLAAMETVAESLADATDAASSDRHLAALPYATLLENIGGLYAPLLAGACICAPGLSRIGLKGASELDVPRLVATLNELEITTCIMIPQMLHGLVAAIEAGMPKPKALRYIAVGGAPVSEHLLSRAEALGLPVYEGYGLSEAASVVSVNRPGANKPGSVGKPLPHVELRFAADGEILVRGSLFSGYLGEKPWNPEDFWPTGDIGSLDDEGFLHLGGRKKHLFITAFGRNVSPEWVERELAIEPAIAQACVFGEARPFNVAVIVPRQHVPGEACRSAIQAAIEAANARLPDYARVSRWLLADEPFSVANGLWTGTGRPRRQQILAAYRERIDAIYHNAEQGGQT